MKIDFAKIEDPWVKFVAWFQYFLLWINNFDEFKYIDMKLIWKFDPDNLIQMNWSRWIDPDKIDTKIDTKIETKIEI